MSKDVTHRPTWRPPHCPNPACDHHQPGSGSWPYRKHGFFRRRTSPQQIQRYLCLACRRSFSNQTFSTTYWHRRPTLLAEVMTHTVGGMANRQIARTLGCAPSTVDAQLGHLGRHCLLFHRHLMQQLPPFVDIVIDGLSSFEFSQYYPFEHLHAVDRNTSWIIHHTDAPLRRRGRMTAAQQRRRTQLEARHGRPDGRAIEHAADELLQVGLAGAVRAVVRSDEHRDYVRPVRRQPCEIEHRRTSSRRKRDRSNELFEANALDVFLRHSSANHRRETIAFSRRRADSAYRLSVFTVWRNCIKRRWEKRCRQTPAMLLGLAHRALTADDVLNRRLFPEHYELPASWRRYYWRQVWTPVVGVNREHRRKYAF